MRKLPIFLSTILILCIFAEAHAQEEQIWQESQKTYLEQNFDRASLAMLQESSRQDQTENDPKNSQTSPVSDNDPATTDGEITEQNTLVEQERETITPAVEESTPQENSGVDKTKTNLEDDDSVLGFNFLYFIIQRFKLSEIVE